MKLIFRIIILSKKITFITVLSLLFFTSCRKEESELIEPTQEEVLKANSTIANLMIQTTLNDGSLDNIIDNSNCFTVQLPIAVTANGIEVIVNTLVDLAIIEAIFDEFDTDTDSLQIQFPITVILADFSEVILNDFSDFTTLSATCNGENESDIDIECVDFNYPISASVFNSNNELIEAFTFNNDHDLHDFIENLDVNDIVTIDFPISITISNGSIITINNLIELETAIETYKDDCDEDDDYDYNDDDCDNCTNQYLIDFLTGCNKWTIDKFELNDTDLEDNYTGYEFTFLADNTITVISATETFLGTWSVAGSGNNIKVIMVIDLLSDFNNSWILHEFEQEDNQYKVDFRLGEDRLRFESNCVNTAYNIVSVSSASVIEGSDLVHNVIATSASSNQTYLFALTNNTTTNNDYVTPSIFSNGVTFDNGTGLITVPSGVTNFTVTTQTIDDTDVESTKFYDLLIDEVSATGTIIDNDSTVNLTSVAIDGLWIVSSYLDNGVDDSSDFIGYQLNFDINGTVVATNGMPIDGTWTVQNNDTELVFNFESAPFQNFNVVWEVISFTEMQIALRITTDGGNDVKDLILQKL